MNTPISTTKRLSLFIWLLLLTICNTSLLAQGPCELTLTLERTSCGAVAYVDNGSGNYTYLWSEGSTTDFVNDGVAGQTYTVTVTDAGDGCTVTGSITIPAYPSPSVCHTFDDQEVTIKNGPQAFDIYDGDELGMDMLDDWFVANGTPSISHSNEIPGVNAFSGNQYAYVAVCEEFDWSESAGVSYPFVPGQSYQVSLKVRNIPYYPDYSFPIPIQVDFYLLENAIPYTYVPNIGCSAPPTMPGDELSLPPNSSLDHFATNNWVNHTFTFTVPTGSNYQYLWFIAAREANQYIATTFFAFDDVCIIPIGPEPLVIDGNVSQQGNCLGTIDVTVTGGNPPYSYLWSNGATTEDLVDLASADYTVTVTDATGCEQEKTFFVPPPFTVNLEIESPKCENNDGKITIETPIIGGTPPFTYAWNNGTVVWLDVNLHPGIYTITITDANGCSVVVSQELVAEALVIPSPSLTGTCSSPEYELALIDNFGNPITTGNFLWSTGETSPTITVDEDDIYWVDYTNSEGCYKRVEFTYPQPLTTTFSTIWPTCGNNDGMLIAIPQGGSNQYTYAWSNGATTSGISGIGAGSYTVTITDILYQCTFEQSTTLTARIDDIELQVIEVPNQCNNPSYLLALYDDLGILSELDGTFSWSYNGTVISSSLFIGATQSGTYSVTFTAYNGCVFTETVHVNIPDPLSVTLNSQAACTSESGIATATVTGGVAPYTYTWSPVGPNSSTYHGLDVGGYSVTVTDSRGCTVSASGYIEGGIGLSIQATPSICNGNVTYTLDVQVAGLSGDYEYIWSDGSTSDNLQDVPSGGIYSVTVTDLWTGCTATSSAELPGNYCENFEEAIDPLDKNHAFNIYGNGNGTLLGNWFVPNGTPAIGYSSDFASMSTLPANQFALMSLCSNNVLFNDHSTEGLVLQYPFIAGQQYQITFDLWNEPNPFSGVEAIDMELYLLDNNIPYTYHPGPPGCTALPAVPTLPTNVQQLIGPTNFTAASWQTINVPVFTASQNFMFLWFRPMFSGQSPVQVMALMDNLCITPIIANALQVTGTTANALCSGQCNGSIDVTVQNGTSPYTYQWGDGPSTEDRTALCPGDYTVTVTDAAGCSVSQTFTIEAATVITVKPENVVIFHTACDAGEGSINIHSVNGGTSPYTFQWSTGGTGSGIFGLNQGTYTVTVTDANGCTGTQSFTIKATLDGELATQVNCEGPTVWVALVDPQGQPYTTGTFNWSFNSGSLATTGYFHEATQSGIYSVTYTNSSGCVVSDNITITIPNALNATVSTTHATCGANDGSATVNATGGTVPYTYLWSTGETTQTIDQLSSGTYDVTVTDANGCEVEVTARVEGLSDMQLTAEVQNSVCSVTGGDNGSITILVSSGVGPYTYHWKKGQQVLSQYTGNTATGLSFGTYTIAVVDVNGCGTSIQVTVQQEGGFTATAQVTHLSCLGETDGSISIEITNGSEPFTYAWSNGQTSSSVSTLGAGTYTVTITDARGCVVVLESTVEGFPCCDPTVFQETHTHITQAIVNSYAPGSYVIWPERVFVDEWLNISNVGTLDITNSDVVFDSESGILFRGSTNARINNSVLRPCSEATNWIGLIFMEGSKGQVNTSTIKNAFVGVAMQFNTATGVAVANNLFKNCMIGTAVTLSNSDEPITGNTYLRDDHYNTYVPLALNLPGYVGSESKGIVLHEATLTKLISENDFADVQVHPISFSHGIIVDHSQVTITKNNFANVYRALDASDLTGTLSFTDNEISYMEGRYLHTTAVTAIKLSDAEPNSEAYIGNNKISYDHQNYHYDEETGNTFNGERAIYAEDVRDLVIVENDIKGFDVQLHLDGVDGSTIAGNKLFLFHHQGILLNECTGAQVMMNELHSIGMFSDNPAAGIHIVEPKYALVVWKNKINMAGIAENPIDNPWVYAGICNGIEYSKANLEDGEVPSAMHIIQENCIYDTYTGVYFFDGNTGTPNPNSLPSFSNNYLYNYTDFGTYIENYIGNPLSPIVGDIGHTTAIPQSGGRNSFISNFLSQPVNWGGAVDIFSQSHPIYSYGNSSNLVINPNVQLIDPEVFYTSNASCGGMVGNNEVETPAQDMLVLENRTGYNWEELALRYDGDEIDNLKGYYAQLPIEQVGSQYVLQPHYLDVLTQAPFNAANVCEKLLAKLAGNTTTTELDNFYSNVVGAQLLGNDELIKFKYAYLKLKSDPVGIVDLLNNATASNTDMADWITIKKIEQNISLQGGILRQVSAADLAILQSIASSNGTYASLAQAKLSNILGSYAYKHADVIPVHAPKKEESVLTQGSTAMIFPNPFSDKFQLIYRIEEKLNNAEAYVTDILGQRLMTIPVHDQNGVVEFDLAQYANGVYIVSVVNGGQSFTVNKVVKGH